jgi:hypothetical protein
MSLLVSIAPPVVPAPIFEVHGAFTFAVTGTCPEALDGLTRDFWFFRRKIPAPLPSLAFQLELLLEAPRYDEFAEGDAAIYTPRNVVYHSGSLRVLDFGGRGLAEFDARGRRFRMRSLDPHLLYEAAYLFLLSQIGEACDARGLSRLHALAAAVNGRALLVVLPMGGGKSTLGEALLDYPAVRILSDDSPLIDRRGSALAFPLHIGLLHDPGKVVPARFIRHIHRMEFGPKYLVDPEWFGERIAAAADPGVLIIGRRTLAAEPRVERGTYRDVMRALVPAMILGVGLFQGLEYLLQSRVTDLFGRTGVLFGRLRNAHALIRASRCYLVHLSRDSVKNARLSVELANELGPAA